MSPVESGGQAWQNNPGDVIRLWLALGREPSAQSLCYKLVNVQNVYLVVSNILSSCIVATVGSGGPWLMLVTKSLPPLLWYESLLFFMEVQHKAPVFLYHKEDKWNQIEMWSEKSARKLVTFIIGTWKTLTGLTATPPLVTLMNTMIDSSSVSLSLLLCLKLFWLSCHNKLNIFWCSICNKCVIIANQKRTEIIFISKGCRLK